MKRTPNRTRPVPNRLREWRKTNGYSLTEVSGLTGISVGMLSRAERGERGFSPRTRVLLARNLGARVDELFDVEELIDEPVPHNQEAEEAPEHAAAS